MRFYIIVIFWLCSVCFRAPLIAATGDTFEHFFLREFTPSPKDVDNIFEDNPFYFLSTIPNNIFYEEYNLQFFENNSKEVRFPDVNLSKKYYYDTKARANNKILVLLFGTLWDPDILNLLRVLASLHGTYSMQDVNQRSLERQFRKWFRKSLKVGFEFEDVIDRSDEGLAIKSGLKLEDLQKLEDPTQGARLFMIDNLFVLFNQMLSVMREIPFKPDVTFAFVATSANDADANEILKEEHIPFAFLNDSNAIWTNKFVETRVPAMLIVDHEGKIAYQGEVLNYIRIKTIIDRLMVRVFKYLGDIVEERFREIRRQRYEEKLEKELLEKMLKEGKEGKESG